MSSAAHKQKRADRAERLRVAGEGMYKVLANPGCTHREPESNEGCKHCQRRARVRANWNLALLGGPPDES